MSTQAILRTNISTLLVISCLLGQLQVKAQTIKETIDWLNSKYPPNPIVYGEPFKSAQRMKINPDGTFQIVHLSFEFPLNTFNPKVESTTILKGNLKDFNPSSVNTRMKDGLLFIDLGCFNGKNCIVISQSGENQPYFDKQGVTFGAFYTDEREIAERLKKALIHLIKLCGGKKEAF